MSLAECTPTRPVPARLLMRDPILSRTHRHPSWLVLAISSTVVLQGCVAGTNDVEAVVVPAEHYEWFSCEQVEEEARRVAARATAISGVEVKGGKPRTPALDDRVLIAWPTLFFVNGNGLNVDEFARLKGEFRALKSVSANKQCGLSFEGP